MFTSIAGRSVVVTGATRGIGKGIARVFAASGARVLIVGRDEDAATSGGGDDRGGAEVSYVLADVSVRQDCRRIAETAAGRLGGIDVLCANAGIFPDRRLADMTTRTWTPCSARTCAAASCPCRPACPHCSSPRTAGSS